MTPRAALVELLRRVGAERGAAVLVSNDELNSWPTDAVAAMKSQGLIAKARPATYAVCPGCERECVMPVHSPSLESRNSASFIVCDKRDDTTRVTLTAERLTQWRCNAEVVCGFIANSLGLRRSESEPSSADLWHIGMASGDKRRQMLCLRADSKLALVAGDRAAPLTELIEYEAGRYSVDGAMVRQLVDSANTADKRYTTTNARREARKLDSKAMYEGWQKKYRALKKQRKDMSDVWYAQQIAKMEIANGRTAGTIRKNMKP